MKCKKLIVSLLLLAAFCLPMIGATAQSDEGDAEFAPEFMAAPASSAFTYQGYLTDNHGVPFHDWCDINVGLWDSPTGGTRIGAIDCNYNVQVMHGHFTLWLNDAGQFGADAFNGDSRYLELIVQCDTGGQQVVLQPRQALNAKGAVRSSAVSSIELSPYDILIRDDSAPGVTLKPMANHDAD